MTNEELHFEPFTIWMTSEYGKIPIHIEGVEIIPNESEGKMKLEIDYRLVTEDENFPEQLKNLDEDGQNDFLTVIRVAVHDCFRELIEKEINDE